MSEKSVGMLGKTPRRVRRDAPRSRENVRHGTPRRTSQAGVSLTTVTATGCAEYPNRGRHIIPITIDNGDDGKGRQGCIIIDRLASAGAAHGGGGIGSSGSEIKGDVP